MSSAAVLLMTLISHQKGANLRKRLKSFFCKPHENVLLVCTIYFRAEEVQSSSRNVVLLPAMCFKTRNFLLPGRVVLSQWHVPRPLIRDELIPPEIYTFCTILFSHVPRSKLRRDFPNHKTYLNPIISVCGSQRRKSSQCGIRVDDHLLLFCMKLRL